MKQDENRSDVRGDLSLQVKFEVMTREEYKEMKRYEGEIFSPSLYEKGFDINETLGPTGIETYKSLVNYLLQIDAKLDRVLSLLSRDEAVKSTLEGIGLDISGTGMKIYAEESVEVGKIIHTKFFLLKFPLTIVDVFGEVIWVTPVNKDGKPPYHIGVRFLDLNAHDRERIINFIFKKQREAIRKRNNI